MSPFHIRGKKSFCLGVVALLAILATANVASAATYTWDGGSTVDSKLTTAANWVNDIAPPSASAQHDVIFTGGTRTDPLAPAGNIFYVSITFDANCLAGFTIGATDSTSQVVVGTSTTPPAGGNITNNSPYTQTFTPQISSRTGTFAANTADLVFNGNVSVGGGQTASTYNTTVDGAKDVYFNAGVRGKGTDSTTAGILYKNGSGTLFMGDCPISTSNNPTTGRWNGKLVVNNGAVRVGSIYALGEGGAGMGRTTISGDTANSGRLELTGGISLPEYFYLGGRQGASADAAHIASLNGGGSITLTGNIITQTGGTEFNLESKGTTSGDLLTISGTVANALAGSGTLNLRGAGNGVVSGNVTSTAGTFSLAKKDAGVWTIESFGNTYTGVTTIYGGTLKLGASASISNSPVIDVQSGTFDVTAVAGFTLAGTQTLKGAGIVAGTVTTASSSIGPPGTITYLNDVTKNLAFTGGKFYDYRGQYTLHGAVTLNDIATEVYVTTPGSYSTHLIIVDPITGDGGITKTGNGPLTLMGNNTYTGPTTVSAGVLELSSTGLSGSNIGDIVNLVEFRVSGGTHAVGVITGTGMMSVLDSSVLTAASINQGSLIIGGSGGASATVAVPEPAVWSMLLIGLLGAAFLRRVVADRG